MSLRFVATLLLTVTTTLATPLSLDLGLGLSYRRVQALPADLPPASPPAGALVLDLRYTPANADEAAALQGWLRFRPADHPAFILVNQATAPAIQAALAGLGVVPGVLTLGPDTAGFTPDITLPLAAATERLAYEALATAAEPAALLEENRTKSRYDEAATVRDHFHPPAAESAPPLVDDRPAPTPPASPEVPAPLIDRSLQRAVHQHRALLALRRPPATAAPR